MSIRLEDTNTQVFAHKLTNGYYVEYLVNWKQNRRPHAKVTAGSWRDSLKYEYEAYPNQNLS